MIRLLYVLLTAFLAQMKLCKSFLWGVQNIMDKNLTFNDGFDRIVRCIQAESRKFVSDIKTFIFLVP